VTLSYPAGRTHNWAMFGLDPIRRWFGGLAGPDFRARNSNSLALSEEDLAELTEIGRQVAMEYGASSPAVIRLNLARLVSRRVPVRAIRSGGTREVAGLCFADGTVVLVRGFRTGDLGRLAVRAVLHQLTFEDYHAGRDGVIIDLASPRERVSVLAVGLDRAG